MENWHHVQGQFDSEFPPKAESMLLWFRYLDALWCRELWLSQIFGCTGHASISQEALCKCHSRSSTDKLHLFYAPNTNLIAIYTPKSYADMIQMAAKLVYMIQWSDETVLRQLDSFPVALAKIAPCLGKLLTQFDRQSSAFLL